MMRHSIQNLWKNVTGGESQPQEASNLESNNTDINNVTHNTAQRDEYAVNMVSMMPGQAPNRPDTQVSDGDKAGATLLFSGIFLSLVGMTFTVIGWINYEVSNSFEWQQLLGPILLSVGGTFVLISVCKFRMFSCQACKLQSDEGIPEVDMPPLSGPSFVFSGVNQPITFHRATVLQYIPPPYTSVVPDRGLAPVRYQSSQQPLAVTLSAPPQYYSVYPMDNPAFSSDNDTQERAAETREARIHNQNEVEEEKAPENISPPLYEELYPPRSSDTFSR
ncbi:transmembrane protein 174 [Hoplias malabaricus]|uniref:transmembrane protein 174 n=1 Tax=Hoplias malabaricus TaxID=27720 RepID=UPI00346230C1